MPAPLAFPRPLAWDHSYWLCRCQSFRVDSPAGRIGRVVEIRFGSRLDRPDALVIQSGLLGQQRLTVPVTEVDQVVPAQQRLLLHSSPQLTHAKRFERLRKQLVARISVR